MRSTLSSAVRSRARPAAACTGRWRRSGSAGARSGWARPAPRRTRGRATVKRSPAFGMRPAHSASRPATVVERPSGARRRTAPRWPRARRCRRSRRARARWSARRRTSSSCSSKISPTSSSSRSSSVAMPSVPPNSSSTTARWRRSRCMSSSRSPQSPAGRRHRHRTHRQRITRLQLNRSKACSIPMMSSSVPR